jgi:hypothetical protein
MEVIINPIIMTKVKKRSYVVDLKATRGSLETGVNIK